MSPLGWGPAQRTKFKFEMAKKQSVVGKAAVVKKPAVKKNAPTKKQKVSPKPEKKIVMKKQHAKLSEKAETDKVYMQLPKYVSIKIFTRLFRNILFDLQNQLSCVGRENQNKTSKWKSNGVDSSLRRARYGKI